MARDGTRNKQADALWFLTISLRDQGRLREALETITRMEHLGEWGVPGRSSGRSRFSKWDDRATRLCVFDSVAWGSFPELAPGQIARHRS
jgi:hypothetical protein